MSITESLRDWLLECPQLAGQRLNTNYLGAEAAEFSIVEAPVTPVVSTYLDGTTVRQKSVALTAVQDYSPDILLQLAASGFWETVADWIEARNDADDLPDLGPGREATSIAVSAAHYVLHTTATTARYQLQMLLTYDQYPDEE